MLIISPGRKNFSLAISYPVDTCCISLVFCCILLITTCLLFVIMGLIVVLTIVLMLIVVLTMTRFSISTTEPICLGLSTDLIQFHVKLELGFVFGFVGFPEGFQVVVDVLKPIVNS
uniref:Uncharacterized protein n=1 Tax=Cacopsylla melanoneura TaxID=428564 RepID=A0A8D8QY60_9HEMI